MALVGGSKSIGTASTTLLTVPATLEASLHSLLISNPTSGNLNVTLSYFDSSASSESTLLTQTVTGNTTLKAFDAPVNMAAGDKINASASASGLVALVSRFENSSTPAETGFNAVGNWTSTTTFGLNAVVFLESDRNSYLSRIASNQNKNPSSNASAWQVFGSVGLQGDLSASGTADLTNKTFGDAVTFSASITANAVSDVDGNLRNVPQARSLANSANLVATDVGNFVLNTSANNTFGVANGVFGTGQIVSIVNKAGSCTIVSQVGTTGFILAGAASATSTAILSDHGVCSLLFIGQNSAFITGNVS